jgi:hypothetical protein
VVAEAGNTLGLGTYKEACTVLDTARHFGQVAHLGCGPVDAENVAVDVGWGCPRAAVYFPKGTDCMERRAGVYEPAANSCHSLNSMDLRWAARDSVEG